MQDPVIVNKAEVEREYLKDVVAYVRTRSWLLTEQIPEAPDHQTCEICSVALSTLTTHIAYRGSSEWLCAHCFDRFVEREDPESHA